MPGLFPNSVLKSKWSPLCQFSRLSAGGGSQSWYQSLCVTRQLTVTFLLLLAWRKHTLFGGRGGVLLGAPLWIFQDFSQGPLGWRAARTTGKPSETFPRLTTNQGIPLPTHTPQHSVETKGLNAKRLPVALS